MATERKILILYWIVATLVVFNLSLMATMFFFSRSGNDHPEFRNGRSTEHKDGEPRHFLSNALSLNKDQEAIFDSSRRQFFKEADTLFKSLRQCRTELYYELSSADPDSARLNEIAVRMGKIHSELKLATIRHFLILR